MDEKKFNGLGVAEGVPKIEVMSREQVRFLVLDMIWESSKEIYEGVVRDRSLEAYLAEPLLLAGYDLNLLFIPPGPDESGDYVMNPSLTPVVENTNVVGYADYLWREKLRAMEDFHSGGQFNFLKLSSEISKVEFLSIYLSLLSDEVLGDPHVQSYVYHLAIFARLESSSQQDSE